MHPVEAASVLGQTKQKVPASTGWLIQTHLTSDTVADPQQQKKRFPGPFKDPQRPLC